MNLTVITPVTNAQLNSIIILAEKKFSAQTGDVIATMSYETRGTFVLNPPWTSGDYDRETLETTFKTIVNALGENVHTKDFILEFLPDGSVGYTVTQESYGFAKDVQSLLQSNTTNNAILEEVQKTIAAVTGVMFFSFYL